MSSKKGRGLSLEEKRKRLCEIFYEKRDFFQLKDLEKMAPKLKGIVTQSVKEVLQSLVDDDLVKSEKIGTSNYFWSFPSAALQTRRNKIQQLGSEMGHLKGQIEQGVKQIGTLTIGREESEQRSLLESELEEMEKQNKLINKELEKYKDLDPDLFDAKKKDLAKATQATNLWTDNIFTLQSYCSSKFNISQSDFNAQFQIPEELDYI